MTVEAKLSLRRLRTTPARKPRTECCCQLVAFINASRVVPPGERNISIAVDCFVSARLGGWSAGFLAKFFEPARLRGERVGAAVRFLEDLIIWIYLRLARPPGPHHRSPAEAIRPAGRSQSVLTRLVDGSTALIVQKGQSILDHFIAHFRSSPLAVSAI